MNRRAVAAAVAGVVLVAGAVAAVRLTRGDAGPRWRGRPLAADRRTGTELVITPIAVRRAEATARRLLGDPDAVVTVAGTSPVTIDARTTRPVDGIPAPTEQAAEAAAARVMAAYGMDVAQWKPALNSGVGKRTVRYAAATDAPLFPWKGGEFLYATFEVDAEGLRAFRLPMVRLATRPVPLLSEREAFARVTVPGTYRQVHLVLIDDGKGLARPYYDFTGRGLPRRPILAVLTP